MRSTETAPDRLADEPLSIDRFVLHRSTVPASQGQPVALFMRERATASSLAARPAAPTVLLLHGGFAPSIVAYDLGFRDYSLMAALARQGFDVFTFSHTGYAPSPRPRMDDPANVSAEFQHELIPHVLAAPCPPRYPFRLVSSQTEWDEIHTVVEFIRDLRGVDRVHLIGWSTGAPRAGGYAARHPDRVGRLVLFGPSPFFDHEQPPDPMPMPGAPTLLQTREFLLDRRWRDHVLDPGQIEDPEVCDAFWGALMAVDEIGASWGRDGRGIMRAPNRMNFGWRESLQRVQCPTLCVLGEQDNYARRIEAWQGLRAPQRAFLRIAGCSHFMQFERARRVLWKAAGEWLSRGELNGATDGEFAATIHGSVTRAPARP